MMLKIGDVVRIRTDLTPGVEYDDILIRHDMVPMFGETGIVKDVIPEERAVKVGDWWWSERMVVPVQKFAPDVFVCGDFILQQVDKAIKSLQAIIDELK